MQNAIHNDRKTTMELKRRTPPFNSLRIGRDLGDVQRIQTIKTSSYPNAKTSVLNNAAAAAAAALTDVELMSSLVLEY